MENKSAAVVDRELVGTDEDSESLDMNAEIPGMDISSPNNLENPNEDSQDSGNTPDQAQQGREGGGTSDGDGDSS